MTNFFALIFTLTSVSVFAQVSNRTDEFKVLSKEEIIKIVGHHPGTDSSEEAQDFELLHRYQDTRTQEECRLATLEDGTTLKNFFGGPKGPLSSSEVKKADLKMIKVYAMVGLNVLQAKNIFERKRPYLKDNTLKPCVPLEKSSAYPSGHATLARVMAKVLATIFPEKEKQLLRRADEIARNRVLGGVHHPTDVIAGKKLGDALADIYLYQERFLVP